MYKEWIIPSFFDFLLSNDYVEPPADSDKFEVRCLNSKRLPILKIWKKINSQDVKDSKRH